MSTSKDVVEGILDALRPLPVRARAMFGEYGIYCDEKIVALVCDDRFYLKPSAAVDAHALGLEACSPYPGAKDYWILDDRLMQDRELFQRLIQATAEALPAPKRSKVPRKKR